MGFEKYSRSGEAVVHNTPQPSQLNSTSLRNRAHDGSTTQPQQRSFASLAGSTQIHNRACTPTLPSLSSSSPSVLDNAKVSLARWFADRILPFKKPSTPTPPKLARNVQPLSEEEERMLEKDILDFEMVPEPETAVKVATELTNAITKVIDDTSRMSLSTTDTKTIERRVFEAVFEAAVTPGGEDEDVAKEGQNEDATAVVTIPFQARYDEWKSHRAGELENELHHLDSVLKQKAAESTRKTKEFLRSRTGVQALIRNTSDVANTRIACEGLLESIPHLWKQTVSAKIEAKVDEIVQTSSNLLKECVVVAGGLPKEATMVEKVRLKRLMEFCSSIHERTTQRAALFKQMMEQDAQKVVDEACTEAVRSKLAGPKQLQEIVQSLPEVPTEAAKNIQLKLTQVLDANLGRLDHMAQDLDTSAATIIAALKADPTDAKEPPVLVRKRKVVPRKVEEETPSPDLAADRMDWRASTKKRKVLSSPDRSKPLRPFPRLHPSSSISLRDLCIHKICEDIFQTPNLQFRLPEELLQQVISHLVSNRAISDQTLERVLCPFSQTLCLDNCTQITNASCSLISRTCKQLRRLSLNGCTNLSTEGITEIAYSVPYLESLSLAGCHSVGNSAIQEIAKRCPHLYSLNVRGCNQLSDLALTGFSNLQELDLSDALGFTEHGLKSFLERCFSLTSLKLSGRAVTDDCIETLATNCPNLRYLDLASCEMLTDVSIRALSKSCKQLERLNLSFCKGITGSAFSSANSTEPLFPCLSEIDLTRTLNVNDKALAEITRLCPQLRTVNLSSCEDVSDEGVIAIAQNLNYRLHDCNLSNCPRITDSSIVLLAKHCPNLQRISLYNCHGVTDAAVEDIASHCRDLISLDLSSCEKVTDSSLIRLAKGCPSLGVLCLEETAITNEGLLAIARSCRSIHTLKLAYCKVMTDAGLSELAKGCPEMQHLDLSYCNNISLQAIQEALNRWTKLNELHLRGFNAISVRGLHHQALATLNLSWCKHLEDSAVMELGRGCPSLTDLDLAWCTNLTASAVRFLAQECSLRNVNLRGCVNIQVKSSSKKVSNTMTIYR